MALENQNLASLLDIETAAQQIQRYCLGISRIQFEQDDKKQAAVLYRIGVIEEAVKCISPDFCDRYLNVPWRQIAGMRDIVMHQYDRVNLELVWDVAQTNIPELFIAIAPLLPTKP